MERPNGLTAVGSVSVAAGTLSACCNTYGVVSSAAVAGMGAAFGAASSGEGAQMVAMQRETMIYAAVPAVFGVVVAMVLIAGGGLALAMKPAGRPLLIGALVAALFVAFGELALAGWSSYRMSSSMGAMGGGGADAWQSRGIVMGVSMGMGALWLVVKLGVYVPCLVYMLRGDTAAIFLRTQQIGPRGD